MRNKTFTRLLALLLALMCLVSSAVIVVGAEGVGTVTGDNLTDKSIADYKETLDTISYAEYQGSSNFPGAATVKDAKLFFDMTDGWVFENGDILVTSVDGDWKMTVLGATYASRKAAEAAGVAADRIAAIEGSESVRAIDAVYETLEEALSVKNEKNEFVYEKENLPHLEEFDGKMGLYTPGVGTITWTLDLKAAGIVKSTLVSIAFDYFPVIAKNSAIEREFAINGKAPFSEARALRFSKVWSSYQQGSTVGQTKGLVATSDNKELVALVKDVAGKGETSIHGMRFTLSEDGKSVTLSQPEVYTEGNTKLIDKYTLRFFTTDKTNNELRPAQLQDPEWLTHVLADSDGFTHTFKDSNAEISKKYTSNFFGFVLTPDRDGLVKFSLKSVNEPMALSDVRLLRYESTTSYADYKSKTEALVGTTKGQSYVKLEAENTSHSSTNVVYPIEDRASALTSPADTTRTVLNTIGTEKWATAGQWVEYNFTVDSEGWYDIYARFKQSYLDGMYVNRSLQIYTAYGDDAAAFNQRFGNLAGYYNGLPFAEAASLRYNYSTDWQVTALNSTNDANVSYQVYFRPGVVYTLRLEVTLGSMSDMVREIERILNVLNNAYLDIIKLTGTTPDDYRDYSFYRLLPETLTRMNAEKASLEAISRELRDTAKVASTYTGVCDKLVDLLRRMLVDGGSPIAKNLDTYKSYVGSLGTFLTDAKTQPLQLDYLTIQSADVEAPKAVPNFFVSFWHETMSFIQSFFRDYNSMGATDDVSEDAHRVNVWVPYGRDQANVIRNLSTNGFTQKYGVAVDLKLVTGGTLLPSILAGMGPDVYIGLDQATVINYAIRGALQSLEGMEGNIKTFDELMMFDKPDNERIFNEAATTVLKIADADGDDHYYGLPENQNFSMMFVRLDVLADLDIEIPKTWSDLYVAQSVLESNNMEIGVSTEYKYFLYQMGGNLWADDGMRINLDSKVGLAAFEEMCAMFTQYSFPYTYDAANRFRTGEMPIVIAGYTGLYNQLKVFATELDGCWAFVPVPGWENVDENGNTTINNVSISSCTAVIMISGLDETAKEYAWDYMVWYTDAECQADYANEMVAIMGDSAKHSTATRSALSSMPWTAEEYSEMIKQFDNLASIENYPGYYYIDRYTNFAFLAAYNDGADPSAEILSYINTINTEITRKRAEFGLETLELGQKLPVKRLGQATEAIKALEEKFDESAYAEAIKAAKYGIANANPDKPDPENILKLEEAAALFEKALLSKWDKSTKQMVKVSGDEVTVPSYYRNISKQTMEQSKGGYAIADLNELELAFFISEALTDAAEALDSYLVG